MPRIAGIDLPGKKRVEYALTAIHGVGVATSRVILQEAGVDPNTRTENLREDETARIRAILERYKVEGDKRQDVHRNIKRLMDLGCYRGLRHRRGLPVRGQRTRTNARTRKGPRKAPVTGKKAPTKK